MSTLARTSLWTLALSAAATLSGAPLAAQGIPDPAIPLEPTTAQLEGLRTRYNDAVSQRDAAAAAALYAENAVLITSDGQVFEGRPAIEEALRKQSETWGTLTSTAIETRRHGSWGWQVGSTEMRAAGGSGRAQQAEAGRYLVILGKERGVWKIRALVTVTDSAGTSRLRASR